MEKNLCGVELQLVIAENAEINTEVVLTVIV